MKQSQESQKESPSPLQQLYAYKDFQTPKPAQRDEKTKKLMKPKNKANYTIYPLSLINEFYQQKIYSPEKADQALSNPTDAEIRDEWSARFIITCEGEFRLEKEGTSISSSTTARHGEMTANGPGDIKLASEGEEVQYPPVLAAGKIYFAPGQETPIITGIDANSGCYKIAFGSTGLAIGILSFCETSFAEKVKLHDLYGTGKSEIIDAEKLHQFVDESTSLQALKDQLIKKNSGEEARTEVISIKKDGPSPKDSSDFSASNRRNTTRDRKRNMFRSAKPYTPKKSASNFDSPTHVSSSSDETYSSPKESPLKKSLFSSASQEDFSTLPSTPTKTETTATFSHIEIDTENFRSELNLDKENISPSPTSRSSSWSPTIFGSSSPKTSPKTPVPSETNIFDCLIPEF